MFQDSTSTGLMENGYDAIVVQIVLHDLPDLPRDLVALRKLVVDSIPSLPQVDAHSYSDSYFYSCSNFFRSPTPSPTLTTISPTVSYTFFISGRGGEKQLLLDTGCKGHLSG